MTHYSITMNMPIVVNEVKNDVMCSKLCERYYEVIGAVTFRMFTPSAMTLFNFVYFDSFVFHLKRCEQSKDEG